MAGIAAHLGNIVGMAACFHAEGQPEDTMQTCIVNFLRKIGVTDGEMDAIRENMLENV